MTRRPRSVTAEEAAHLISCGESPEIVAATLGMRLDAIAKACRLCGDAATANVFGRRAKQLRRPYELWNAA